MPEFSADHARSGSLVQLDPGHVAALRERISSPR
jgi:hypothetical protein